MRHQSPSFGAELRRRRLAAGRTIAHLAAEVHYSKAQISKIETGHKRPTPEFARLCDEALGAAGALGALVPGGGDAQAGSPSRRQMVALGAASVLAQAPAAASALPLEGPGGTLLDVTRALFDQFRTLGQIAPPEALLPSLRQQTHLLRGLASRTGPRTARGLLVLASRHAEFAGWMAQEAGDDGAAGRLTDEAVRLAEAAGDRHLASYALVRRALMAYYQGDGEGTVALCRGAQSTALPARIRGLAAQLEAQGHALGGDRAAYERSLDNARRRFAADGDTDGAEGPMLGTTHVADPAEMTAGWSLFDLGRPREAAAVLDEQCALIPGHALRTIARYGVRRALAHAVAGEVPHACEVARPLLGTVATTGSATVRADVRRLSRTLTRYRTHPAVRDLAPGLAGALHARQS
ncbi:helix-turn-helix domain-containing protein [Streptomyces sp. NPDC050560]|uniref:helix-turn-helix domain-containing protein n=1 Tax=Streptomyces sp. NPDC050560 TaxID=3365630 RepID=UPI00378D3A66